MNKRPSGGERVVLVHVNFPSGKMAEDLAEFQELAMSAGAEIVATVTTTRRVPESKYFIGSGKAEEIKTIVQSTNAQLIIFNHVLSPAQERNLERLTNCRVIDRTRLILDIFAQRARSFEGKLQVELAQLKHMATRLVRVWTHLERQRGGIGLRGPGETQIETDRRLIRNKIKVISDRLTKLRQQRELSRRARRKAIIPTIALVGYTNAGKSTLFNLLTGSAVYVANQLFATLDPTLRRVEFKETGPVILADTVGFIRHLPHTLIEAFHATLEEVSQAQVLLHIVDASDEQRMQHIEQVNQVLESIGANEVPRLLVHNKIDLCTIEDDIVRAEKQPSNTFRAEEDTQCPPRSPKQDFIFNPKIDRDEWGIPRRVYISATKELGIAELITAISEFLGKDIIQKEVMVTPSQAKIRAKLYEADAIVSERTDEEGNWHLVVRLPQVEFDKLFG